MIFQQLLGQQVFRNTSKMSFCRSEKGKEGSVLPRISEAYNYKLSTGSSDLAKKNTVRDNCFRLPRLLVSSGITSVRAGCQVVWQCVSHSRKNTTEMHVNCLKLFLVCQTEVIPEIPPTSWWCVQPLLSN